MERGYHIPWRLVEYLATLDHCLASYFDVQSTNQKLKQIMFLHKKWQCTSTTTSIAFFLRKNKYVVLEGGNNEKSQPPLFYAKKS